MPTRNSNDQISKLENQIDKTCDPEIVLGTTIYYSTRGSPPLAFPPKYTVTTTLLSMFTRGFPPFSDKVGQARTVHRRRQLTIPNMSLTPPYDNGSAIRIFGAVRAHCAGVRSIIVLHPTIAVNSRVNSNTLRSPTHVFRIVSLSSVNFWQCLSEAP